MNMKNVLTPKVLVLLTFALMLVGCKKSGNSNTSRATGWQINDKEGGFQYNTKFKEQYA